MFEFAEDNTAPGAKIKVIGIGGGGGNAINTMIRMGLTGVEFIAANTDRQALEASLAGTKIQLGGELTKGLGAGSNPEVGRRAAMEDYAKISELLSGSDMIFVTAGMGGGTGTGAAPIIAKIAKEVGALTVGVVTKPFMFEGKKRMKQAEQGLNNLRESVDSLITIPNNRLLNIAGSNLSMLDTFKKADEVLLNAVQGISDLINHTGLINSDFADVKTIMANKGLALMGIGLASGDKRALEAATAAISSPLLEDVSIDGATGIIINITGGSNLKIHEVNEATTLIMEAADEDAEIIFGTVIDENMKDSVKVTVIATGLGLPVSLYSQTQQQAVQAQPVQESITVQASAPSVSVPAAEPVAPPVAETVPETSDQEEHHTQPQPPAFNPLPQSAVVQEAHVISEREPTFSMPASQPIAATPVQAAPPAAPAAVEVESEAPMVAQPPAVSAAVAQAASIAASVSSKSTSLQALKESMKESIESSRAAAAASAPKIEIPSTSPSSYCDDGLSDDEEDDEFEAPPAKSDIKGNDLNRAKAIAQKLGLTNMTDDEYDIPTFIRRQQEHDA